MVMRRSKHSRNGRPTCGQVRRAGMRERRCEVFLGRPQPLLTEHPVSTDGLREVPIFHPRRMHKAPSNEKVKMSLLSPKNIENLRALVAERGMSAVARELDVSRYALSSVLLGCGRTCTARVVAAAYLEKAGQLHGARS